jgi:hypothetical protein
LELPVLIFLSVHILDAEHELVAYVVELEFCVVHGNLDCGCVDDGDGVGWQVLQSLLML